MGARALFRFDPDIGVRVQKALPVGHPSGRFAGLLESDPKILTPIPANTKIPRGLRASTPHKRATPVRP
jgi:hypothetical protein